MKEKRMKIFTIGEILKATGGKLMCGNEQEQVSGFSIDSREVGPKDMFFATKGSRNDAHDFIPDVIKKGCRCLVVANMERCPRRTMTI